MEAFIAGLVVAGVLLGCVAAICAGIAIIDTLRS